MLNRNDHLDIHSVLMQMLKKSSDFRKSYTFYLIDHLVFIIGEQTIFCTFLKTRVFHDTNFQATNGGAMRSQDPMPI